MKWKLLIFPCFIVLAFVLLFFPTQIYWMFFPHTQNDVVIQVFRDREIFYVIQNPQTVTAQLLQSKETDPSKLDGYTRGAPRALSPPEIQGLQNLFEKPSSYHWGMRMTSGPDYGVLLNFRSQGHTVHVALCLKCNKMGVFDGDDDSQEQVNRHSFIDPMRAQLVTICKAIFPNDKDIQSLQ